MASPSLLAGKVRSLRHILGTLPGAAVAFSGGVDSTLLLAVCREVLGRERVLALTAHSELMAAAELEQARTLAGRLDARHLVVAVPLLEHPAIAANRPDRCYRCKRLLFARLQEVARAEGLGVLLHGANRDDDADFRPGMRAADELGVRAPLWEAGLTKAEVRELSWKMGLPTWDLPPMACLATRIPYDTPLTQAALRRVEAAESFLRTRFGLSPLRVRDHFPLARIEVSAEQLESLAGAPVRGEIVAALRELGYRYVTLDLQGFRSGSLNEGLPGRETDGSGR